MGQSAKARRFSGSDFGAGLVEFALILPLLMALFMGIFSGGVAYNRKISITNAVREGARFGATLAACSAPATCDTATWSSAVSQRVVSSSGGELGAGDVCVALVAAPDPSQTCGVQDPAGTAAGLHIVKVSASRTARFDVVFFSRTVTLRATSANRYEREPG